jgi:putative membrane protein
MTEARRRFVRRFTGRFAVALTAATAATLPVSAASAGKAGTAPAVPPPTTAAPATAAPAPGAPPLAGIAAADRSFVTVAASTALLEVEASRLALQRSRHPEVRAFAQRVIDDHRRSNQELTELARDAGMADVPRTTMGKYTGRLEKLRMLKDAGFDREYAAQIGVAGHVEAVAHFDQAATDAQDPELKAFAARELPALREHLEQAESMARAVGVSAERMKEAATPPDLVAAPRPGATATGAAGPSAGR